MNNWCKIIKVNGRQILFVNGHEDIDNIYSVRVFMNSMDFSGISNDDIFSLKLHKSNEPISKGFFEKIAVLEVAERVVCDFMISEMCNQGEGKIND